MCSRLGSNPFKAAEFTTFAGFCTLGKRQPVNSPAKKTKTLIVIFLTGITVDSHYFGQFKHVQADLFLGKD